MKRLLLLPILLLACTVRSQVLNEDGTVPILFSYSSGYHYQGFHGTELLLHLTAYTAGDVSIGEAGIFLGTEFNFGTAFETVAPDFGIEYIVIPSLKSGWGMSGRVHATLYRENGVAYLAAAPELAVNYGTAAELYYAYNYMEQSFDDWTPHRIGFRLTIGYPRTAVNAIAIAGGL